MQSYWRDLSAEPGSLEARGFQDVVQPPRETNRLKLPKDLERKTLFEGVVEYEQGGKTIRRAGVVVENYYRGLSLLDGTTNELIALTDGADGVTLKHLYLKGGLTKPEESIYRPNDWIANPNNLFHFALEEPGTGKKIYLIGTVKKVAEGYEVRSIDGNTYILDNHFLSQFSNRFQNGKLKYVAAKMEDLPPATRTGPPKIIRWVDENAAARTGAVMHGLEHGELYSPEFFDYFSSHLPDARSFLLRLYPSHNPSLLISRVENELGPDYLPLFLHPEVASRWGDALEFAKRFKAEHPGATSHAIFKAFEKSQGTIRLYRGMVLTEAQAATIRERGMNPVGFNRDAMAQFFNPFSEDPNLAKAFEHGAAERTKREPKAENYAMVQSFTKDPLIAESVPYSDAVPLRGGLPEGKAVYVFEVDVPNWGVRYSKDYFKNLTLRVSDHIYQMDRDADYEQIFGYPIPPDAIVGVRKLDHVPPRYSVYPTPK